MRIQPTVGRIVHLNNSIKPNPEPIPAMVTRVIPDDEDGVNRIAVRCFIPRACCQGLNTPSEDCVVRLIDDGETTFPTGWYAEWPPHTKAVTTPAATTKSTGHGGPPPKP